MADKQLVKITGIRLYVGFTESSADCFKAIQWFKTNNIPYILMNYSDQEQQHKANFDALSTWDWGLEGIKKQFTDYPFVTWEAKYDDWSTHNMCAHGLQELLDSELLVYKDKIDM